MAGMKLVDGVYYTPEDLARKLAREAAAEARREAQALDVASRAAVAQVDVSDDRIRAILTELLEPVIEAIENLEGRVSAIEGARDGDESDDQAAGGGTPHVEPVSAASEAESTVSDGVPAAPAKATTRKAVKK